MRKQYRTAGDGLDLSEVLDEDRRCASVHLSGDADGYFSVYLTDEDGFDIELF